MQFSWRTRYNRRRDSNEGDIESPQKDNQCGYYNIHEEVNHLPQPLHEREASFHKLEDCEVVLQRAGPPYASRPLGGKEASRLMHSSNRQGSEIDNRAIGGELSFVNAPPDKTSFDRLLLPLTVLEEQIFSFPFMLSNV